jgi:hypothetical protein
MQTIPTPYRISLLQPIVLTPANTEQVSGGGSNVRHGNGDTFVRAAVEGGDGGASHSGFTDGSPPEGPPND